MADNKSDGLLGGMIVGAALGAIAGILAAPRTGRETRHILKKSADALPELAEDLATSIQFQADRLSDKSLQNWEQTLVRLREAVVAGQAASRQEWQKQQDNSQPSKDAVSRRYSKDYSKEKAIASTAQPATEGEQAPTQ
ncbi:MAG: YtxH domain-containing protein [Cyanobacteria bacterium P01_D01_bin.105]